MSPIQSYYCTLFVSGGSEGLVGMAGRNFIKELGQETWTTAQEANLTDIMDACSDN